MGKGLGDMIAKGYCWILPPKYISRSFNVRCGTQSLNLWAEESGDPNILSMLCPRCFVLKFVLHFTWMMSKIQIYSWCHQMFLLRRSLPEWKVTPPSLKLEDWPHRLWVSIAWWVLILAPVRLYWYCVLVDSDYYEGNYELNSPTAMLFCQINGSDWFTCGSAWWSLKVWAS